MMLMKKAFLLLYHFQENIAKTPTTKNKRAVGVKPAPPPVLSVTMQIIGNC
ncbi:hypothetical protein FC18_GL000946 [Lacticaseibacillus sharpeae JCM 1186 = DSM 20505]|uniref:Uncharacterized protein n=1 Tax=Lacticaseibacillus sharpeae JCM 1186 = DSM 20505 TaxID=1291052 RepID=A0A0R1ZVT6_9LACO|nr:hypothetical protein FC18_GL000946 [Lacticaseibacillus sharpeae JCM 1186 = DSM 20505]